VYFMSGSSIQGAGIGGSTFAPLTGYTAPTISTGFADIMLVTKKYVYVPMGNSTVEGFSIDRKSGTLTAIPGSPFTASGTIGTTDGAWSDPQGRFLFVGSEGGGEIWVFQISPTTGALTETAGSPFTVSIPNHFSSADVMTVDASGKFLYVGQLNPSAGIEAFSIDQTTGALTEIPGAPFFVGVAQVHASLTGEFLLGVAQIQDAGSATDTHIHVFAINPTTGVPTEVNGSPFLTASAPFDFAISPNGKFVYTVGTPSGTTTLGAIEGFQMDLTSGALTKLAGSPFTSLPTASECAFDQSGAGLVCADTNAGTKLFVLGASSTGALTNAATFSGTSGGFPFGVTD
jgi:6-phosphogluconolactonase (cycloisomerase 2 family)